MRLLWNGLQRAQERFWRGVTIAVVGACLLFIGASVLVGVTQGPQKGVEFALTAPGYVLDNIASAAEAGYKKGKKKFKDWCKPRKPRKKRDNDRPVCTDCPKGAQLYEGKCYTNSFGRPRPGTGFLPEWCKREEEFVEDTSGPGRG